MFTFIFNKKLSQSYLQQMVQSGKRLDENICTFVRKFIPSRNEEVQNFVEIKVVVADINT